MTSHRCACLVARLLEAGSKQVPQNGDDRLLAGTVLAREDSLAVLRRVALEGGQAAIPLPGNCGRGRVVVVEVAKNLGDGGVQGI